MKKKMMMKHSILLIVIAAALSSCKAGSIGGSSLNDNEQGTMEGKIDREGDFAAISSLVSSAMFMIPYNIDETNQYYDYLYTAKDADKCQGGDLANAECQDQLLELFAVDGGIKTAAYAQQFFMDSNVSFLRKLQKRTAFELKDIGRFQQYAEGTDDIQAVSELTTQMSKQLYNSPLAEVTVVPTLHFDGQGTPKCFSYSVSIRQLNQTSTPKMDIPADGYKMNSNQYYSGTKNLEIQDWKFSYASDGLTPDAKAQGYWHNRYLVADFSNPFEARQELFFGLMNRSFQDGLKMTAGDYPEDKLAFECSNEAGDCGFMKGEDKPGPDRCRLFHSL